MEWASGEKRERRGGKYETVPDRLAGVCAVVHALRLRKRAGQADLQSIQKADVRELYEALYSDVAEAEDTYVGSPMRFWARSSPFPPGME